MAQQRSFRENESQMQPQEETDFLAGPWLASTPNMKSPFRIGK
jgi:hypothetical protein